MDPTGGADELSQPGAPEGMRLEFDAATTGPDVDGVVIGGAPMRILRLSPGGAATLKRWQAGEPVGAGDAERTLARRLLDAGIAHPLVAPLDACPAITLVCPVLDDAEGLDRLLAAELVDTVVVVDDGSADPGPIAAVGALRGARVRRLDRDMGPGQARMAGLAEVRTELVVFADADVEMDRSALATLAAHFDDPAVVAVAPRIVSRPGPSVLERYEADHSPLDLGDQPGRVGPKRRVSYVPTAVLLARVDALRAIGGFDPALRWGEDVDLVWRLAAAGHTIRYEPSARATHRPRSTWTGWLQQRRRYGGSAAPLGARHGDVVAPARSTKGSLGAWLLAILGRPVVGAVVAAATSRELVEKVSSLPHGRRVAARVFVTGQRAVGRGVALAVARVWWPFLVPFAVVSRRARTGLALSMIAPAALRWRGGSRSLDPIRSTAIGVVDDVAYGFGVWEGCVRARDLTALRPDVDLGLDGRTAAVSDTVARS